MPEDHSLKSMLSAMKVRLEELVSRPEDLDKAVSIHDYLATCITDSTGKILRVSPGYCQLTGYEQNELLGNHFAMVVPPEIQRTASLAQQKFHKNDGNVPTVPGRFTVRRKNGSLLPVSVFALRIVFEEEITHKVTIITPLEPFQEEDLQVETPATN